MSPRNVMNNETGKDKPKVSLLWDLRVVMAKSGIFTAAELYRRLTDFGLEISTAQVSRAVMERPQRPNMDLLIALVNVLDCDISDLLVRRPETGQGPDQDPNPSRKKAPSEKGDKKQGQVKGNVIAMDRGQTPPKGRKVIDDEEMKRIVGPKVSAFPRPERE